MTPPADDTVATLFAAHAGRLRLYARQWVGPAAAEDVVQRVFVRLIAGKRLPADPRTWLYRCARNAAIDAGRSDRRRGRRERSVAATDPIFAARPEDPLDAAAAEAALAALPPRDREVVTLRIWSGLTLAEVAAVTGMPVSTVHDRYRAALSALRRHLEPSCENRAT